MQAWPDSRSPAGPGPDISAKFETTGAPVRHRSMQPIALFVSFYKHVRA
jgi:hypothetical protein